MSGGPWKSEPSAARARASIVTAGNIERRFRRESYARDAFEKLEIGSGGGFAALFVKQRGRWLMKASKSAGVT